MAAKGESFVIDENVSNMSRWQQYCGFTDVHQDSRKGLQRFLSNGEKLTGSIVSLNECKN